MERREEKSHTCEHSRETRGHMFNFEQVEVLATEAMEGPRRVIEAVYTKLRSTSINKAVEVPGCYYQVLRKQL